MENGNGGDGHPEGTVILDGKISKYFNILQGVAPGSSLSHISFTIFTHAAKERGKVGKNIV